MSAIEHIPNSSHVDNGLLRFLTCGSVDDGKSTLIGRLLYDTKAILADTLHAIERTSRRRGLDAADLSLLTDGLQAEREQGITIDVAYRYFSTGTRKYIIADAPGHEQYTRNMVTAASTADLAIILIDARKGVLTQTRRHSYIAHLVGIPHLVVAVNKMDLVDYVAGDLRPHPRRLPGFRRPRSASPTCASSRCRRSTATWWSSAAQRLGWYAGRRCWRFSKRRRPPTARDAEPFRFPVQYVCRPQQRRSGAARLPRLHGSHRVGRNRRRAIRFRCFRPGVTSRVKDIRIGDRQLPRAVASSR